MNLKTVTITGILLFSVAALAYSPIGKAFAEKKIYIVNNLDVPLKFQEIKNKQNLYVKTHPPNQVKALSTGSFTIAQGDLQNENQRLNVKYYVNNSASGEQVGIIYKKIYPDNTHCSKDHPDDITEEVKHCGNWSNNKDWQYIYTPK